VAAGSFKVIALFVAVARRALLLTEGYQIEQALAVPIQ